MSADPLVTAVEKARAVMDGLGDNPAKAKLDAAWRALDELWEGSEPATPVRRLLRDHYETLAMLYGVNGWEAPA